jgi:hypothetical protein
MPVGHPRSFQTVEQLQEGINAYFDSCHDRTIKIVRGGIELEVTEPLTISGLACYLDVDRSTLHAYSAGDYDDETHPYSYAIKKAGAKIEADKVSKSMLGMYDRSICIFDLKNNHGWRDEKHITEESYRKSEIVVDKEMLSEAFATAIRIAKS